MVAYWLLLPLIFVYAATTKPRSRVLLVHNNHLLLVKNWLGAGNWSLPGGGLESNESPAQAAIREIKEELGVTIEPSALKELGQHVAVERGGLKSKYYLYVVKLTDKPTLAVKANEITGYIWLPVTDALNAQKGISNTVKQSVEVWSASQNLV